MREGGADYLEESLKGQEGWHEVTSIRYFERQINLSYFSNQCLVLAFLTHLFLLMPISFSMVAYAYSLRSADDDNTTVTKTKLAWRLTTILVAQGRNLDKKIGMRLDVST